LSDRSETIFGFRNKSGVKKLTIDDEVLAAAILDRLLADLRKSSMIVVLSFLKVIM